MKLRAAITLATAFVLGATFVPAIEAAANAQGSSRSDIYRSLELFGDILSTTLRNYIRPVDEVKLLAAAEDGMLKSLDPQSGYIPAASQVVSSAGQRVSVQRSGDIATVTVGRLSSASASEIDEGFANALSGRGKLTGLIVDLTSCDGGRIDDVAQVADRFLDGGVVVIVRSRSGEAPIKVTSHDDAPGARMAVLIGPKTAEAGEILAGALHEGRGATLVGARTAGRDGIVTMYPVLKGSGGVLSLLTGQAKLPSGAVFGGTGLAPQVAATPDVSASKALLAVQ